MLFSSPLMAVYFMFDAGYGIRKQIDLPRPLRFSLSLIFAGAFTQCNIVPRFKTIFLVLVLYAFNLNFKSAYNFTLTYSWVVFGTNFIQHCQCCKSFVKRKSIYKYTDNIQSFSCSPNEHVLIALENYLLKLDIQLFRL